MRRVRFLLDTGADNKGGGSGADPWKEKYDALKAEYSDLKTAHDKLTADNSKLTKDYESASGKLAQFEGREARKSRLDAILGSPKYKGKTELDTDKAMKFLERGAYDPSTLDSEIHEAIELFGREVKQPENPANPRGGGSDAGDRTTKDPSADPIGDFARSLGR